MVDNGGTRRRNSRRWLWIIAGIAGAGAVCAVVGIWHLPDRMYPGTSDGAVQARAALQGGLLTAAAALTAVAGGLIALDETRQANSETRRANRDTHVRELYVEAVKLLNDAERGIRLAGIYALERIAVDSPADQRTVVEVLSAFVRDRSTDPALRLAPPPSEDGTVLPVRPWADIRAAVQVLGRLPIREGIPRCDLTGADLTGPAGLADLTLTKANLTGASLSRADLTDARLDGADLTGAQLDGADFTRAQLRGANFTEVQMERANFTGAELGRADLTSAGLLWANFTSATLDGADLTYAWPGGATFTNAWLRRANFTDALLDGADLTGAQMGGATLTGARLYEADLTGAVGLSQVQVDVARGDAGTRLPAGLVRPASWGP